MIWFAIGLALVFFVVFSHVVEALRAAPPTPETIPWAPEGASYGFTFAGGLRLRRLKAGKGRPILLLHTLRTQMDLFRDVFPALATEHEVHAIDLPGHGYSEIPDQPHSPDLFAHAARSYLDAEDLTDVVIVGESIGGTVGLLLAADRNPRVAAVVAVNSYDYASGTGIMRGSLLSRLLFTLPRVPLLGASVWRLRWYGIFARVIRGSVHDPRNLPEDVVREMHKVGNRSGHLRAFLSLVANFREWEALRARYPDIAVHVRLVYGGYDWSHVRERDGNARRISGSVQQTVPDAGHLLSLEVPEAVVAAAREAAVR